MEQGVLTNLLFPNDALILIAKENILVLDSGQKILVTDNKKLKINFFINDSLFEGTISQKQLERELYLQHIIKNGIPGTYDDFFKQRREAISKITKTYNISEIELFKIIGSQYQMCNLK